MSSHVFYRFKSQKEPSRISFDGTGISVWDLKKEIIMENKMGKGGDFDFAIYNEDTEEGTRIIPVGVEVVSIPNQFDAFRASCPLARPSLVADGHRLFCSIQRRPCYRAKINLRSRSTSAAVEARSWKCTELHGAACGR